LRVYEVQIHGNLSCRVFDGIIVVETKQIVSSDSNVIFTRQTFGSRLGMAAEANADNINKTNATMKQQSFQQNLW